VISPRNVDHGNIKNHKIKVRKDKKGRKDIRARVDNYHLIS